MAGRVVAGYDGSPAASPCPRGPARPPIARATAPSIATCLVSQFPRAVHTARLGLDGGTALIVHLGLDEIDYGSFEADRGSRTARGCSRPEWTSPPGGRESRQQACDRMLRTLEAALTWPGPRLVVGHGLMISLLIHLQAGGSVREPAFPEAPYVEPLVFLDAELRRLVHAGRIAILATGPSRQTESLEVERGNARSATSVELSDRGGAPSRPARLQSRQHTFGGPASFP